MQDNPRDDPVGSLPSVVPDQIWGEGGEDESSDTGATDSDARGQSTLMDEVEINDYNGGKVHQTESYT